MAKWQMQGKDMAKTWQTKSTTWHMHGKTWQRHEGMATFAIPTMHWQCRGLGFP
jgi:hypothetical protein